MECIICTEKIFDNRENIYTSSCGCSVYFDLDCLLRLLFKDRECSNHLGVLKKVEMGYIIFDCDCIIYKDEINLLNYRVKCPLCREKIIACKLNIDLYNLFSNETKKYNCDYCNISLCYKKQIKHKDFCDEYLIYCPLKNCKRYLKRKNLKYHIRNECEFCLFNCDYCFQKIKFKDFNLHKNICSIKNSLIIEINRKVGFLKNINCLGYINLNTNLIIEGKIIEIFIDSNQVLLQYNDIYDNDKYDLVNIEKLVSPNNVNYDKSKYENEIINYNLRNNDEYLGKEKYYFIYKIVDKIINKTIYQIL